MSTHRLQHALLLIAVLAAVPGLARAQDNEPPAFLWQPRDLVFSVDEEPTAPFQVDFSAQVKGPGGVEFTLPGFYDGNRVWKLRVAPTAPGAWEVVTRSSLPALDGRATRFTAVENQEKPQHGPLRIDRAHPRHFQYEDGTRFYPMGYECDWLWALDLGKSTIETTTAFLDLISASGFNYVIVNSYAYDTGWRKGKTGDDDYGPPPIYPWPGSNEKPEHGRFNLEYWQHYDRMIAALNDRGMVAHMLIKVYNKMVNWPARGSAEDDQFFRWLIARYAAYPNVVWDFSKEAHNEKDLAYKQGRLRFLKENDPYHHLRTVHDDDESYAQGAYDDLVDFRADQQHGRWRQTIASQRAAHEWPIINVEFGYEHGPGGIEDKTYKGVQPPEEVTRRAWELCLAGAYTAYYYTYTAWDVIRPDHVPPGYAYFKHLRDFFESTRYWELEPANDRVSTGYCLANPGHEYVVFLDKAQHFELDLGAVDQPLQASWYNPLTGQRQPAALQDGKAQHLHPPAEWGQGMVALHVAGKAGSKTD